MISNEGGGGGAMEGGIASQKEGAANQSGGGLKKGPWTAAEDAMLIDYVKKHGEGNWNSVQKNSGLMRCGKSCRLRWANHLRPNLKKGSFTPEEEKIIIELHAKLGNKWARMASQLPGRTDNEIKNFWNTRMKRRQRAGLPIYPQELQEAEASGFHIQRHQHSQDHQHKHPNNNSSFSFSSLLSSSRKASYNPSLSLLDPSITFSPSSLNPLQDHHFTSFYSTPTLQFNSTNSSLALPSSNIRPFNNHQNFALQTIPPLNYNNSNTTNSGFETNNISFTSLIMGSQAEPIGLISGRKSDVPSDQTPPDPNSPSGGVCVKNNNENDSETNMNNSGLLDALLFESHNLSRKEKFNCENSVAAYEKGKRVMDEPIEEKEEKGEEEDDEKKASKRVKLSSTNAGEASFENHCCNDLSSSQSSIGMKPSDQEQVEEMNSMDDDYLFSLLVNFPSSTPLPEWYLRRSISYGLSSDTIAGDGHKVEQETSTADHGGRTTATATNDTPTIELAFGSSYWNNMPSIC